MRKTFKKYLIPHPENNHKPYFLRLKALSVMALFVFIVEVFFFANVFFFSDRVDYLASVLPGVLVSLTNESRVENDLSTLSTNSVLQMAAQMKANDMAAKGYFAHTSPEGLEPWHWLRQAGYAYSHAGENLAVDFVDSGDVTKAWMRSPLHRANIVNKNYSEVGIAVASGVYKGKNTMFVVQFFGTPQVFAQAPTRTPVIATTPTNASMKNTVSQSKTVAQAPVEAKTTASPATASVLGFESEKKAAAFPIVESKINSFIKPIEKIVTSPRTLADYLLGALALFLVAVLAMAIFIAIRIQHPNMIAGAVAMIVFIAGVMYFNTSLFNTKLEMPKDTISASAVMYRP